MEVTRTCMRELNAAEIAFVAGGTDPTPNEVEIQNMYTSGGETTSSGPGWAITTDAVLYQDNDNNGWFDYAEISAGGAVYVYDTSTDSWKPKEAPRDDDEGDKPKTAE